MRNGRGPGGLGFGAQTSQVPVVEKSNLDRFDQLRWGLAGRRARPRQKAAARVPARTAAHIADTGVGDDMIDDGLALELIREERRAQQKVMLRSDLVSGSGKERESRPPNAGHPRRG